MSIDALVDAHVQANGRGTLERRFQVSELPRLTEAGIFEPTEIRIGTRFSIVEGHVAVDGTLGGFVTMTCQRCVQPVQIEIADEFQLLVVDEDTQSVENATGYEPIVANAARLDLRWLAEEQALLNVPLVPKHEDEACAGKQAPVENEAEARSAQRPFADLKSLLRKG